MELTDELLRKTRELGVLTKFPGYSPEAVARIAENIARICTGIRQAEALIAEMTGGRFDEWPGPATLRGVYDEMYPPDRQYHAPWDRGNGVIDADHPNCEMCLDLYVISTVEKVVPCTCIGGLVDGEAKAAGMMQSREEQKAQVARSRRKNMTRLRDFSKSIEEKLG